jgi:Ca2+-binding EF-hand superfamily protein
MRNSFKEIFDLFVLNGNQQFTPDNLVKFYAISNVPLTLSECNSIFMKFSSDPKFPYRGKQMDCERFVNCMESYVDKILSNIEKDEITLEIQESCLAFLENNNDCIVNLLDLPPDLSQSEIDDLLAAMRSQQMEFV